MADLGAIADLVQSESLFPLARNARGLDRTLNPVGAVLVSADLNLPFPEDLLSLAGNVSDIDGVAVARDVIALSRSLRLVVSGSSASDGAFSLSVPPGTYRVIFSGEPDHNDLIFADVDAA